MFTFNGFLAKLKTKFSTNKTPTNNHRFPLVLSDGTPDGNATPADIMQFLGGITTSLTNQNDLNDVVSSGVYSWSGSGTAPLNNFKPQGSLLLVWKTGTQIFQVQWPNTFNQSSVGIGFRLRWNNEWSAWYKILLSLDQ